MSKTVAVIREFFAIRYSHSDFGARPDQTHPDMVSHPLADGRYVVQECETMTAAYVAAHAAIGQLVENGPLKGRSIVGGDVEVIRAVEHEPVTLHSDDPMVSGIWGDKVVVMTITGTDHVKGIPHWSSAPLTRYHPVNGWEVPATITV